MISGKIKSCVIGQQYLSSKYIYSSFYILFHTATSRKKFVFIIINDIREHAT